MLSSFFYFLLQILHVVDILPPHHALSIKKIHQTIDVTILMNVVVFNSLVAKQKHSHLVGIVYSMIDGGLFFLSRLLCLP